MPIDTSGEWFCRACGCNDTEYEPDMFGGDYRLDNEFEPEPDPADLLEYDR